MKKKKGKTKNNVKINKNILYGFIRVMGVVAAFTFLASRILLNQQTLSLARDEQELSNQISSLQQEVEKLNSEIQSLESQQDMMNKVDTGLRDIPNNVVIIDQN